MGAYAMSYATEFSKVCVGGIYFCVNLPARTLQFCWKTQVFLICLPFRCTNRIFHYLKCQLASFVRDPSKDVHVKLLEHCMQCDLPSEKDKVLKIIHEFRAGTLIAITKMNQLNRELGRCRRQLTCWKIQAERQAKQLTDVVSEEKKLLKVILTALRRLRTLKSSRENIDNKLKITLEDLLNFSKSLSSKEFFEKQSPSPAEEINEVLKTGYAKLQKQAEQIRLILDRINSVHLDTNANKAEKFDFGKLPNIRSSLLPENSDVLNLSLGTLDTIIGLLNTENSQLKKRLKVTNEQLDDVKVTSSSVNDKISHLEGQLVEVISLLNNVEADRDSMRSKLLTLQNMIEEEEVFLNDDSSGDDSFCDFSVTSKDFTSNDFDSSSPLESLDNYCDVDIDLKRPKSSELSVSR